MTMSIKAPVIAPAAHVAHVARLAVVRGVVTCSAPDLHIAAGHWAYQEEARRFACAVCNPPAEYCWACGTRTWWQRPAERGGGWCCGVCHSDSRISDAGQVMPDVPPTCDTGKDMVFFQYEDAQRTAQDHPEHPARDVASGG